MGTMMEFPVFYGEEPEAWVSWIEAFVAAHSLTDFETRQLAYGFIGGEAYTWYRDEVSRSGFYSWGELKFRLIKRFSTRTEHEKIKLEWQHRLNQLDRLNDWLERRYPEKAAVEKQQEGSTAVPEYDSNQITSHDGGFLKNTAPVLVPEQNQSITTSEVKDDLTLGSGVPVLASDPAIDVVVCEEDTEEEEAPAAMIDLSEEQSGNMRKKKKRWKKRDLPTQNCSGKNNNYYAYHVFDQMFVGGKRVKKKRKKKKMKTMCRMKRIKHELRVRKLLMRHKRVLHELVKWKKPRLKHKTHKRKKKIREIFSGNHHAFIWNSRLVGELIRGNLRGCCKRNGYVIVYWSYKLMQLKELVKLNCELLLAAGTRKRAKSKLECVVNEKLLSRVKKEWAKVLDWKKHKGKYKHMKIVQSNTKEITNDIYSWFYRRCLLEVHSFLQGTLSIFVDSREQEFHDVKLGYVSMLKAQTDLWKLLEWKELRTVVKFYETVYWSFQVHAGSTLILGAMDMTFLLIQEEDGYLIASPGARLESHMRKSVEKPMNVVSSVSQLIGNVELEAEPEVTLSLVDAHVKGNVKYDKSRRWKYKPRRMQLPLQVSRVERDGTRREIKSLEEGGKCSHGTVELWISCNKSDSGLPRELDNTCTSLVLQWLDILKSIKVNWKEQVETTRTPPLTKWISESVVSAFLTTSHSEESFTEVGMDQELKGVTHILQKRAHDSVLKTQPTIGKFCGLLGSVFLEGKNDDIRFFELVEKSLTATHSFELRNQVWEPGIVAYVGEWKEFEALSNGALNGGLSSFLSKLVFVSKGAIIIKLKERHYLTSVSELIALVMFHLTYVMLHSPRPPEWLGTPYHDSKSEKSESLVDYTSYFRFATDLKWLQQQGGVYVAGRYPSLSKKRPKRKDASFLFSTLRTRLISKAAVLLRVLIQQCTVD